MQLLHSKIKDPSAGSIEKTNMPKAAGSAETLAGPLVPVEWSVEGEPVEFAVFAFKNEGILIKDFPKKKKLKKLAYQTVLIKGRTWVNDYGEKLVKPLKLKKLRKESRQKSFQEEEPLSIRPWSKLFHEDAV